MGQIETILKYWSINKLVFQLTVSEFDQYYSDTSHTFTLYRQLEQSMIIVINKIDLKSIGIV